MLFLLNKHATISLYQIGGITTMSSQIKTNNIAIYTRTSTTNENEALTKQTDLCKEFADKLFSNRNLRIYQDNGLPANKTLLSSKKSGVPTNELNRMLFDAGNKEIDVIIVYCATRLSRNANDLEWIFDVADDCNVPIYEAKTGRLLNLKNIQNDIRKSISEVETNNTKNRIKSALLEEQMSNVVARFETIYDTRIIGKLKMMFDYEINKADSKEMKEYLENLKEDFLMEFE
jgi:DNA invertase Pin-like site-specific DNA recombinase